MAVAKDGDLDTVRAAARGIRAKDALLRVVAREEMMQSRLFVEMAQEMAERLAPRALAEIEAARI